MRLLQGDSRARSSTNSTNSLLRRDAAHLVSLTHRISRTQAGKRQSEAYKELKAKLAEKFERALARHYPKTKGKVEFISIATPLTNLYYLNRADSYGLEHTPAHYAGALDLLRPQTAIPGLYVTGQDCASVGIVGALNGGILTAHAIMGYTFWDLVVAKRNLIEDLMAMDKEAEKTKKTVEVKKEK